MAMVVSMPSIAAIIAWAAIIDISRAVNSTVSITVIGGRISSAVVSGGVSAIISTAIATTVIPVPRPIAIST